MKTIFEIMLLFSSLSLSVFACSSATQTSNETVKKEDTRALPSSPDSMIDERDGETYATVTIGKQTWMAENLRYNEPGSMVNPENPSESYGRLYTLVAAQTACPSGWHLPSDAEWDEVEMAHGMPVSFVGKGGWRGEHGTNMKSASNWDEDGNGTDSLGFNILPAGYYFSEKTSEELAGIQGLGFSAGFWSSIENNIGKDIGYARFLFSSRKWVNKWEDVNNETEAALSCRCVKN